MKDKLNVVNNFDKQIGKLVHKVESLEKKGINNKALKHERQDEVEKFKKEHDDRHNAQIKKIKDDF